MLPIRYFNNDFDATSQVTRRQFLQAAGRACTAASLAYAGIVPAASPELTISRILVQDAKGRRLTPVAPNAYAPYRGYDCVEPILRIQTREGLEGIGSAWPAQPELLQQLIGMDPFRLFRFGEQDRILGPTPQYASLLAKLRGCDVALIDLLGKALKRPASALLGVPMRTSVQAYDGTVYMEDLLKPDERHDLAFIKGTPPADPVEWTARKARWVVDARAEGFKALKIKIGRAKWMASPREALARDVAVTLAIRDAVGPDIKLLVDANRNYWGMPELAWAYAQQVTGANVYFMEEMFPEEDLPDMHEFKRRLRGLGTTKLAAGESNPGGIAEAVYTQRLAFWNGRDEPLIDIEQADMNGHGFLYLRAKAKREAKLGMAMAPHNFGSKLGFYAQVHLGMVTANWELSEVDDSMFPSLTAPGIAVNDGFAMLTGMPGLGVELDEGLLEKPRLVI